jgi:hypothetical protein
MGIKHVVVGVTVVAGGLLLSACEGWADNHFDDSETLSQPVTEVRFANDSGNVVIRAGDGDKVEVRRRVSYSDTKPGRTYRMSGGALVLESCEERNCGVDYEVTVPADTEVSGHVDSGNVELTGVASVNVDASSGNVTVRDVKGAVNAKADSGNVDLSGIGGSVVADASSGNITVGLDTAAAVTAIASSGNVEVTVPQHDYQVDIQGDDITNDLGDAGSGPKITIATDSGKATLRAA